MSELRKLFDTMAEIEESAMRGYEDDISPYDDDKREYEAEFGDGSWDAADDEFRPEDDRLGHNDPDRASQPLDYDELGGDPWGLGEDERGENVPDDTQLSEYNTDVRQATNRIYEEMDEGILDPRAVAEACMSYMSEADVAEMARMNEFFAYEDEEDEDINELSTSQYDQYTSAATSAADYHGKAKDLAQGKGDDEHTTARFQKHKRKGQNRKRGMARADLGRARNSANAKMKSQFGK